MISCKCIVCKKQSELSDVIKFGTDPVTGKNIYNEVWNCSACDVAVHYNDENIYMIVYNAIIREQKYMWSCLPAENKSMISGIGKVIQVFDFIPELTPQNVKVKIKTYLNFL